MRHNWQSLYLLIPIILHGGWIVGKVQNPGSTSTWAVRLVVVGAWIAGLYLAVW